MVCGEENSGSFQLALMNNWEIACVAGLLQLSGSGVLEGDQKGEKHLEMAHALITALLLQGDSGKVC